MQNFDFTPLYRTLVGFDRVAEMIDQAARAEPSSQGYPPYNIEQTGDNTYAIELAVAGFEESDLNMEVREGVLSITGRKETQDEAREFLHRGIAERAFERRFQLADYVIVTSAYLKNGMLQVELTRELPEAMKPKIIAIDTPTPGKAKRIPAGKKAN
ncbi:16 kDa heat shock protein A [hydrothermal vent metagenome]|uniref:16 kDa heat shock protein A n=1 Tax=hydrothermal vent metagenome TaxID=652676 RepID=A0A3B0RSN3_9ZZZZ